MMQKLFTTLGRGLTVLRLNTQYLFVAVLLIAFPLLFVYITESIFEAAYQNISTAQKQQVQILHEAIAGTVTNSFSTTTLFSTYLERIPTLTGGKLVEHINGELIIIAATDESLVGQEDGATLLFATAASNPGNAFIYEFAESGVRKWHAYEQRTVSASTYYIVTEHSFKTVDTIMTARQQQVYLGLSAIFIFLLAVAYWLVRQQNWSAAHAIVVKQRDEQMMFTNTIAHELRAPLTAIKGYASLLRESPAVPKTELEYVKKIESSTERLITLINDFLEVARIQAGGIKLVIAPTEVVGLAQSVIDSFVPTATKKGLVLTLGGVTSAILQTDTNRLTQILTNIVSNAVKYSDTGTVSVVVDQTRIATVIKVKDNGQGISAEDQRRMFAPFTRVGGADASQVTGSGLGMWITKRLVETLDGEIAIESIEGVGTVVKVTLHT